MNVNLTPEEITVILKALDANTFAHSVVPLPDTPMVMDLTLSIITKFRKAANEQARHDARARKLLDNL
jgi:hypothetical protein